MELQQLQQQLANQLEKDGVKVIQSDIWCIPIHTLQIKYEPIQKRSMDILMKILLFSFQKSNFRNAEQLSDILLVEPLFIEDLIGKLLKNGLLEKHEEFYQLSEKGKGQFLQGVFEESLEPVSEEILYSPTHEKMVEGDIEAVLDYDDFPETMYRHLPEEEPEINEQSILKGILMKTEEQTDIEIKKILSVEHIQTNDVPCIEFITQNDNQKIVRVWNTLLDTWDKQLENQITELERGE